MKWYQKINEKILTGIAVALIIIGVILFAFDFLIWGFVCIIPAIVLAVITIYAESKKKKGSKDHSSDDNISTENLGDSKMQNDPCAQDSPIKKAQSPTSELKPPRGSIAITIGVGNSTVARETISDRAVDKSIDKITVIDFETACHAFNSACSIGIAVLQGAEIIDKQYYLIQPPDNFYTNDNIAIHHITPAETEHADTFPAVWEKIKHHFEHSFVAAHNAKFDMSVLKATLHHYGIQQPDFSYIDTMSISGLGIPQGSKISKSLAARCEYFGIPLDDHHNALCDAEAAAQLILHTLQGTRHKTVAALVQAHSDLLYSYSDVTLKETTAFGYPFPKVNVKEIAAATTVNEEKDADFDGKTFVITGEFKTMTREQALSIVVARGGIIKAGISSKVDVLVNADGRTSTKTQKAEELQASGHRIKIVNEEQFMRMLESNEAINLDE